MDQCLLLHLRPVVLPVFPHNTKIPLQVCDLKVFSTLGETTLEIWKMCEYVCTCHIIHPFPSIVFILIHLSCNFKKLIFTSLCLFQICPGDKDSSLGLSRVLVPVGFCFVGLQIAREPHWTLNHFPFNLVTCFTLESQPDNLRHHYFYTTP